MNTTGIWLLIFGLIVVVYIGYDIFAMVNWGADMTISHWLLEASKKRPIIAAAIGFIMGLLLGHIFWPQ